MAANSQRLARQICKTAQLFMRGRVNQWVSVHAICQELMIPHDRTVDEAILYALEKKWLTINPPPVHSVLLTADGQDVARGKVK